MKGLQILVCSLLLSQLFFSCSSDDDESIQFVADFNYEFGQDQNHLVFTNKSTGDYYSILWDFGNDDQESTTNKTKTYETYYPKAGAYSVVLTLKDDAGNISEQTKDITIAQDDPNYVVPDGLIWSDEFNSSTINLNNWTFETGTGDNGWGNNELQNYTNGNNLHISDGKLVIIAKKLNENKEPGSYTSTRIISLGKQEFTYGKIEVRAKLPSGSGIWPAIWMLGSNLSSVGWPACGEIDIMEYVGYEPNTIHATVHSSSGSGNNGDGSSKALETAEEEFHIYGLLWDENSLVFYIDTPDNVTHTYAPAIKNVSNWPFNKPQFFILNVAVGGNWGGAKGIDNAIFPQTMEVDYVRVYDLD